MFLGSCGRSIAVSLLPLALTGCALNSITTTPSSQADAVQGVAFQGQVHGGQQPIAGAHVFLFAANTAGYGMPSISLLQNASNTTLDTSGGATSGDYYVTTNSSGVFTITGDYSCTQNAQVYVYSLGGDAGSGANAAAGLMGVLGNCPAANNFLVPLPSIQINEVTTIAAAYAFSGYAKDAVHVSSSGTALAKTGLANAFANAGNLVSMVTGNALATTPGSVGTGFASNTGTVPQAELYSLGDILSACINSTGAGSTNCTSLLGDAPEGITVPSDTATAAINIAHHPGAHVAALFALQPSTPPFVSPLSAAPNDWTIAVNFTINPSGSQAQYNNLAIDAAGAVWVANENSVIKVSPLGVVQNGVGYFGGGLSFPLSIAIDAAGDPWIANYTGASVTGYTPTGGVLSGASGYAAGGNPYSLAFDASGNIWVANSALLTHSGSVPYSVSELVASTGANVTGSPFTGGGLNTPEGVAIDVSGNAWVANLGSYATEISSTGTVTAYNNPGPETAIEPNSVGLDSAGNKWFNNNYGSTNIGWFFTELTGSGAGFVDNTYSANGMQMSQSTVAIDGSGNIWLTTYGNGANPNYSTWVGEYSNAGVLLTPSNGFHDVGSTCQDASGMAIDGSGDVWVSCGSPAILEEYVGAATPVVTPVVANLLTPYSAAASKP